MAAHVDPGTAGTAFRYPLPGTPVATATVDIGHVGITFAVSLRGDLEIRADNGTERPDLLGGVRAVARGLAVRGAGSAAPTITSAAGHRFAQCVREFRASGTRSFAGTCEVSLRHGAVLVTGGLRYALDVTAAPHRGDLEPAGARGWLVGHDGELAAIGVVVLSAVPFAPGPLTCV